MKRMLLLVSVVSFGLAACNSNKGSYEENEKKTQDSLDQLNNEKGFDDLLKTEDSLLIKDSIRVKDSLQKLGK